MNTAKSYLAAACILGLASTTHAAVAVTEIETSPTASGDVLSRGDYTLTSATAGGVEYSDFELPTTVTLLAEGSGTADFHFWANSDNPTINSPGSAENALNDALISTGAANATPTIHFANSLDAYDRFFLFELGANDTIDIIAVDNLGNELDLRIEDISTWGSVATSASANSVSGAGTGTAAGFQRSDEQTGQGLLNFPVGGLSFTPDEFTGTASLSDASGFLIANIGYDHMLAAAIPGDPIPEPAALTAIAGVLGLSLSRRRRA